MSETIWDREFERSSVGDEEVEWVEEPEQPEEPISQEVIGLLNLGSLTTNMEVRGHEVRLRTLTMDEELEVGLLIQPYRDTEWQGRALATGLVAASIQAVDGKPLVEALGPNENTLRRRFDYVRKNMYWPVIRVLYEEGYIPLVEQQVQALKEFRKK